MAGFVCNECSFYSEGLEMVKHLKSTNHDSVKCFETQETLACEICDDSNINCLTVTIAEGMLLICGNCLINEGITPSHRSTLKNNDILESFEDYVKYRGLCCVFRCSKTDLSIYPPDLQYAVCDGCATIGNDYDDEQVKIRKDSKESLEKSLGKPKTRDNARDSQNEETQKVQEVIPESELNFIEKELVIQEKIPDLVTENGDGELMCCTCSFVSKGPEMIQHLNQQEHLYIMYLDSKKVLACEMCQQANINELTMSKFDQGELLMTCKKCLTRSGLKPFVKYNLNNKGIFVEVDEYYNVLDMHHNFQPTKEQRDQDISELISKFKDLSLYGKESQSNVKSRYLTQLLNTRRKVIKASKNTSKELKNPPKISENNENSINKESIKLTELTNPLKKIESPTESNNKSKNNESSEEYEHKSKYQKAKPKLSYESLGRYYKEMCYNLYLEESIETAPMTNFITEWYPGFPNRVTLFIPYTDDIDKLIYSKFRQIRDTPFSKHQSIFLVTAENGKSILWESFVMRLKLIRENNIKIQIELTLQLQSWNNSKTFMDLNIISFTPASPPTSRIITSMTNQNNPFFQNMLLGKNLLNQTNKTLRPLKYPTTTKLNNPQLIAINQVLDNPITILQGPPGTGKTSTINELILQLVKDTYPILVVAASNVAIDNIAEKLMKNKDLEILRILSTAKESEYNERHHLNPICLHRKVFDNLPTEKQDLYLDFKMDRRQINKNEFFALTKLQIKETDKLVNSAKVILTTTITAGGPHLRHLDKIPILIMDESTQSNEASTLVPLSLKGLEKILLVGDEKQLSSFNDIPYLEQSLFERVLKNGTYFNPNMLQIQYRMNPKISKFPNIKFYENKLIDGVTEQDRTTFGIPPLLFIDYGDHYKETQSLKNPIKFLINSGNISSYQNIGEANLILKLIYELNHKGGINLKDIGIITPYSSQRDIIAQLIRNDRKINPNFEKIQEEIDDDFNHSNNSQFKKPSSIKTICGLMISSIDAFQGREKNHIIFSCVRSNEFNKIGFVKDLRRLNVALTRAKNSLTIVGNKSCMKQGDSVWNDLINHLETNHCIRTLKPSEL
ncbi:Regulator of nonsense transcripts 1 [Wickerhamomyces ciferrii]|uniref:Regulator of nonsense transcripts 1 n=1 Tax=Wickerhamomyces ciferrii (strain ATCC 14091 / BCRC 22168 / CBS 111 / JCM 3599 / NBRC 0793 / NRRL Y-1031 F-60-10) TaxID=1206466 RepID=K0KJM5_WICCF|nr:Regulator of nonsense transcripts 1 [Wickerhamomyces ciferrii]CCH42332.1 Regulator of nonsense transcripts 1 [Wickerhamomyces ciferrii]